MKRTICIKCHLPYRVEHVWLALTDARLLGKWFIPSPALESTKTELAHGKRRNTQITTDEKE